jgi:hypothetical protein
MNWPLTVSSPNMVESPSASMTTAACKREAACVVMVAAGCSAPPPQAARSASTVVVLVIRLNICMSMTQGNLADGNAAHPFPIASCRENFCQLAAAY